MKRTIRRFLPFLLAATAAGHSATAQGKTTAPHFNHLTVYVVDMKVSNEFYTNVMQLEQIAEPFHDNRHTWYRTGEHTQLHVVQGAKEKVPHDINIHMAFSVPSITDFVKHLQAMHIKYGDWQGNGKVQDRPDKVKQIYLQDPDGYWIEVNDDRF